MRIAVLSSEYPGPDLIYGDTFVQARVRIYKRHHSIAVFGYHRLLKEDRKFTLENVPVHITGDLNVFYRMLKEHNPDLVAAHLVERYYVQFLIDFNKPIVVFAHGIDVMLWKRRLMNYTTIGDLRYLIPYYLANRRQMASIRKLIRFASQSNKLHFVFVSKWLRELTERDHGMKINNSHIIANGIDLEVFNYTEKDPALRKRILVLRSFRSRNYAADLAIDTIVALSKREIFDKLEFSIYGEGYLFPVLAEKVKHFSNVTLNNHFIHNKDIPAVHRQHGISLCPTRLDSQGVSMCEAMASGLIPITSGITAIPEFTKDKVDCFYGQSPDEMADKIELLYNQPDLFRQMSLNARKRIESQCDLNQTARQEMDLFQRVVDQS